MAKHEKIKQMLEDRLEELTTRINDIDEDLREPTPKDFEEHATETEGDEVLETLGKAAQQEIAQIKEALKRMENGTYGTCTSCELPIPEARLEAVPFSPLCMECLKP